MLRDTGTVNRLAHDRRTIQRSTLAVLRQLCAVRAAYKRSYQDLDTAYLLDVDDRVMGFVGL